MRHAFTLLAVMVLAAGCASSYGQGQSALRQGRYDEAVGYFNQALSQDPGRSDAVVGLGLAEYRRGNLDQAVQILQRALAERPNDPRVRLYLGLAYLRKGETARAIEQLSQLRAMSVEPHLGAQIDRAFEIIRKEPVSAPVRAFIAESLETQAELTAELQEAQFQAQRALQYSYPYFGAPYAPCVIVQRAGRFFCI